MKKIILLLTLVTCSLSYAQKYEANWESLNKRGIPKWFNQDKFGIFIHWGVYAVPAYAPVIPNDGLSYSEWYEHRLEWKTKEFWDFHLKNYGENFHYSQFEPLFKAELYNPKQWAEVFKNSGAKYVVLTSKHHDGYALWDSPEANRSWGRPWNSVSGGPKRDLLGDLTTAVREEGLKMGYYYSLYEWYNPLWKTNKEMYINNHMLPQLKDLVNKYKPSVIFSDGEWDLSDTTWRSTEFLAWLFNDSPVAKDVVVNDRWGKNTREKNTGATYTTSEYGSGMNADIVWEESQGIGHSYGYNRNENINDYKSSRELLLLLIDIVARGGNLLLDIGPTGDGRIPVIMQERLLEMGDWLKVNGEAIYETHAVKNPYQWSSSNIPKKDDKAYMAGYSTAKLVEPKKDVAHVELFFTQKGKDLYAFLPKYQSKVILKNYTVKSNTTVSVLGSTKVLKAKNIGKNCEVDLSGFKPGEIPSELLVLKFKNML
ncbi:alpha-L-fucosidase [Sphingobacterium bovistauri]|uniref:alpha-L-fucosidase n=1 Tax=Sphingobacterium bovistauri TaxID=2781959 RepID=A0ABS7Z9I3_9SPHI|nr:alpha-L-fucosidase [Sphingobacterium bovistauri]MCA5006222.1 alpha-L-fucosidase [Sphingobacterium bovistauri]